MTDQKFLILGHGTHGKDTVAEMLQRLFGVSFVSSSFACADIVMMSSFEEIGVDYATTQHCYDDRHNHRAFWHDRIAAYNTPDKAKLAKQILGHNNCYVGMRCDKEYAASRHLFNHVLWVEDPRKQAEPYSSFKITRTPGMHLVLNDGTLKDLEQKLIDLGTKVLGLSLVKEPVDA